MKLGLTLIAVLCIASTARAAINVVDEDAIVKSNTHLRSGGIDASTATSEEGDYSKLNGTTDDINKIERELAYPIEGDSTLDAYDDDGAILEPTAEADRKLMADIMPDSSTEYKIEEKKKKPRLDKNMIKSLSLEDIIQHAQSLESEVERQKIEKTQKAKGISKLRKKKLPALNAEIDFQTHMFDKATTTNNDEFKEKSDTNDDIGLEF